MTDPLHSTSFEEAALSPFDFEATVRSHGWAALRPFEWDGTAKTLDRVHQLSRGQVVHLRLRDGNAASADVQIEVKSAEPLAPDQAAEIRQAVRRMLRLDEDLGEFYKIATTFDGWRLDLQPGGGRLLRCPTLFEDIVYTLCTTNIAWSGTIRMVERLTESLGASFPGRNEWRSFPSARAIAEAGTDFLREETGLGYRSAYVWELAAALVENRLDLTTFEASGQPTEALYKSLLQLKGVGPYAAATILMILGRYEHLAIDSEMRAFVSKKYLDGATPTDAQIRAIYEPWGHWQYLAYWFDSPDDG